jgi:hypothetical protein
MLLTVSSHEVPTHQGPLILQPGSAFNEGYTRADGASWFVAGTSIGLLTFELMEVRKVYFVVKHYTRYAEQYIGVFVCLGGFQLSTAISQFQKHSLQREMAGSISKMMHNSKLSNHHFTVPNVHTIARGSQMARHHLRILLINLDWCIQYFHNTDVAHLGRPQSEVVGYYVQVRVLYAEPGHHAHT